MIIVKGRYWSWLACLGALPAVVVACESDGGPGAGSTSQPTLEDLAATYPGAAARLLAAAPAVELDRFVEVRSSAAAATPGQGRWGTSARTLSIQVDKATQLRTLSSQRGEITIRRLGSEWSDLGEDGGAVIARDADGSIDTVMVAREDGVEELVQLDAGERELRYELSLPRGWALREAEGTSTFVEILDDRGSSRFRVRSDAAWDRDGRRLALKSSVEGSVVRVQVLGDPGGRVLVDPLWQDAGTSPWVRVGSLATLLPNGRVLITGGLSAIDGAPVLENELFDPRTLTFGFAGAAPAPRVDHVAVTLPNGKVLIAGGFADGVPASEAYEGKSVGMVAHASAELYDPVSGTSAPSGDMVEPRGRASFTLLSDGRVLIAGGTSGGQTSSTAEIFDPETATFTSAGEMPEARQEHRATLLPDGRVLLSGGTNGVASLATTTLYDPATGFSPGPTMAEARFGHVTIPLPGDRLLVAGGKQTSPADTPADETTDVLSSAEILDLDALPLGAFVALDGASCGAGTSGQLAVERFQGAATLLPSGHVLLAGGLESIAGEALEAPVKTAEIFDPATSCFRQIDDSLFLTRAPSLVVLPSGKVFLNGQSPAPQLFDATSLMERSVDSIPLTEPRSGHTMALLPSGKVLVIGGEDSVGYFADAYELDPDTGERVHAGTMSQVRSSATATRLFDGTILVAGGSNLTEVWDSAELYDPVTRQFEVVGSMSSPRAIHTATLLTDGRVLLAGGYVDGSGNQVSATADLYDPQTKTFKPIAMDPSGTGQGRAQHAAAALVTGEVLVAGGTDNYLFGKQFSDALLFDPKEEAFVALPDLGEARREFRAVPIPDGRVLLVGGSASGSSEVFDPITRKFSFVGHLQTHRYGMAALPLPSGNVVALGGHDGILQGPRRAVEVFDPITETWSQPVGPTGELLDLSWQHLYGEGIVLPDGRALIVGGVERVFPEPNPPDPPEPPFTAWLSGISLFSEESGAELNASTPAVLGGPTQASPGSITSVTGKSLGGFEGLGGGTYATTSRYPVALWLPHNGAFEIGTFTLWSDQSADWLAPAPRYPGPGILFAVTNGLRGEGLSITLLPANQGVSCSTDSQCSSGFCSDGVCCNERCDQECHACSAALKGEGDNGVCGPAAAGENPKNACTAVEGCPGTGVCDGAGVCVSCPPPVTCDGEHTLTGPDGYAESCAPLKCSVPDAACLVTCQSASDCVSGYVCDANGQCLPPPVPDGGDGCATSATPRGGSEGSQALLLALAGWLARRRLRSARRASARENA